MGVRKKTEKPIKTNHAEISAGKTGFVEKPPFLRTYRNNSIER